MTVLSKTQLPIKTTIANMEVYITKHPPMHGEEKKGEYEVFLQELDGDKKYYLIYLKENGDQEGKPVQWGTNGHWSTEVADSIILLAQDLFKKRDQLVSTTLQ